MKTLSKQEILNLPYSLSRKQMLENPEMFKAELEEFYACVPLLQAANALIQTMEQQTLSIGLIRR